MGKPQVSVIIPLYNKERTIQRAVDSVLVQSFADFELIIIDDGSTDKSLEIASQYDDSRIKIIQQANAGPGAARNVGIEEANADLLAFLDADDQWLPFYLQNAVAEINRTNVGIVGTTFYEFPKGIDFADVLKKAGIKSGIGYISENDDTITLFNKLQFFHVGSSVVRTDLARKVRGFDRRHKNGEDTIFFYKVLANTEYSILTQTAVCHHRADSELTNSLPQTLPTIFTDPSCVLNFCPMSLRNKMGDVIGYLSLMEARRRARRGLVRDAKMLRDTFPQMQQFTKLYAKLSREISFTYYYKYWTGLKRLIGPPLRAELGKVFKAKSIITIDQVLAEARGGDE